MYIITVQKTSGWVYPMMHPDGLTVDVDLLVALARLGVTGLDLPDDRGGTIASKDDVGERPVHRLAPVVGGGGARTMGRFTAVSMQMTTTNSHDPGEDGTAASNEGSHDSEKIVVKHEALSTQGIA